MVNLDRNFKEMKKQIYSHMLKTRGVKYKWFIRALRSFKYLSFNIENGNFLESYYILMRFIDDVVDGDAPLPEEFSSRVELVEDKIEFSRKLSEPKDSMDYLMLYCFELADKFDEDISAETQDILLSMLFDAKRIGKGMLFSGAEFENHFYLLDIRGTIRLSLKIFNEVPHKFMSLQPLGYASRIFYNLRDYREDIKAGLINIPIEDFKRYGLSKDILKDTNHPKVKKWFLKEAEKGMSFLKEHQRNLPKADFKFFTRLTLQNVYVRPAEKFFRSQIS